MKFYLLSGALKNAGDFLIVDRSKKILQYTFPGCEVVEQIRTVPLESFVPVINSCDALVFAGGPGYISDIYPRHVPLVQNLDDIKTPFLVLGMGWHGYTDLGNEVYGQKFTPMTQKLFQRAQKDFGALGCRDWYSVRVLRNNGFNCAEMTGCPAWYNLDINTAQPRKEAFKQREQIRNICVSDPARISQFGDQAKRLLSYLSDTFVNAKITLVFHRGVSADNFTRRDIAEKTAQLKKHAEDLGVKTMDISYGCEGMEIYNECDLHIGYRVHAHIYNLSYRNYSILLEEDGRGAGVDEALHLSRLKAYNVKRTYSGSFFSKAHQRLFFKSYENSTLIKELDDFIERIFSTQFMSYHQAFCLMQYYQNKMLSFLKRQ